jgi:hypothetical protein
LNGGAAGGHSHSFYYARFPRKKVSSFYNARGCGTTGWIN